MPENTVYVGRGSKWGNPYRVGSMHPLPESPGTWGILNAEASIALYAAHLTEGPLGRQLIGHVKDLRGKNLSCWCAPEKRCHSEFLLKLANTEDWMKEGREVLYWPGVRSEHYPPRNGTVLQDGVAIFGGTACVRIRKQDGGTDFIQLSHIEPQP